MSAEQQLRGLFRKWRGFALVKYGTLGLAVAMPAATLLAWSISMSLPEAFLTTIAIALPAGAILAYFGGFFERRPLDLAYYLNRCYPELEDSTDLLLTPPPQLTPLARLQRKRVAQLFDSLHVQLPNPLPRAITLLLLSGLGCFILWDGLALFSTYGTDRAGSKPAVLPTPQAPTTRPLPPELRSATVVVQPPAYTGLRSTSGSTLDIEAPAGSRIRWELQFDRLITEGQLLAGDRQRQELRANSDGRFTAQLVLDKNNFYAFTFRSDSSDWVTTDYYRLEVVPDQPPNIEVEGLAQYVEYPYSPEQRIAFTTRLTDDYGIRNARIIATVSRGEGESVKFRDDTLSFEAAFRGGRRYQLEKSIRLHDLGMEAGDELYLHIEADDNRSPVPQTSKTSKYIIAFENPEAVTLDMSGGLAVDRLPEYFRSQRQIIIDTENLLAEEEEIDETSFQERSNNIAIDQKLLRLRYGRFLGEEFQTVIGAVPGEDIGADEHDHEHHPEEEHSHTETTDGSHDHSHEGEHDHGEEASEDGEIAELEPYYHTHDITEEVTFFDATTTAKLRAALAEMWNAELHLRMGRPGRALPYEYQALKLIKEIQQASRIYVERIGFDPPVIKVTEKRLSGDLDEIRSPSVRRQAEVPDPYPAVAAALPVLETLLRRQRPPEPVEYERLQVAGEELAGLAVEQPGAYLRPLQQLRSIMEEQAAGDRRRYLRNLQRVFWSLLPDQQQRPLIYGEAQKDLRKIYLQELQQADQ